MASGLLRSLGPGTRRGTLMHDSMPMLALASLQAGQRSSSRTSTTRTGRALAHAVRQGPSPRPYCRRSASWTRLFVDAVLVGRPSPSMSVPPAPTLPGRLSWAACARLATARSTTGSVSSKPETHAKMSGSSAASGLFRVTGGLTSHQGREHPSGRYVRQVLSIIVTGFRAAGPLTPAPHCHGLPALEAVHR